jgi:hypothetical protein
LSNSLNEAAGFNSGLVTFLNAHHSDNLQYSIMAANSFGNSGGANTNPGDQDVAATSNVIWTKAGLGDATETNMAQSTVSFFQDINANLATFPSTTFGWGSASEPAGTNAPITFAGSAVANGNSVGTAMHFWEMGQSNATFSQVYESTNTIVLGTDGSLTVSASGVPIPAAAWLLGSGLLGLLGIGRRKASPALAA